MSLIDALLLEPTPFEVWIALRSDGQRGSGTQADPFNGAVKLGDGISVSLAREGSTSPADKVAIVAVASHPFAEYDVVTITETGTATAFSGTFQIFGVTATTFKYKTTTALPASSSGTAQPVIYQFDDVMRATKPWMTVRIGPGVFETRGYDGARFNKDPDSVWMIKQGQRIIGAGVGITTLKLMYASGVAGSFAIAHTVFGPTITGFLESFEASDLTVDCNLRQQLFDPVMKAAVITAGRHIRLRRIRAIDFGTNFLTTECFVIGTGGAHPAVPQPFDCRIEDCIIEQPNRNALYNSSCLMFFAGEGPIADNMSFHRACVIRNCYGNCEYLDDPVPIVGITYQSFPRKAIVTTRSNHGRSTDDWVVISGALEAGVSSSHYNGSFKITVQSLTEFSFVPPGTDPLTIPTGNMFVGRFSSQRRPVQQIEKESNTVAILTTYTPHNHKPGDMVFIWHTPPGPSAGTEAYYGCFLVSAVMSPFILKYELTPGEVPTTSPTNPSAFIGPGTVLLGTDGGSEAVAEGNFVFNTGFGGPYHDTWSSKDSVTRNNYYSGVLLSSYQNMGGASALKLGSSLVFSGTTATFYTQNNHGLSAGQQVIIRGALSRASLGAEPSYANPYNGKFTLPVGTDPNTTSFSYTMLSAPPLNAGGSPIWGDVKTGSSLIRKDGAAGTAVFTTPHSHGLSSGQSVTIKGALVDSSYVSDFNGVKSISNPSGNKFEYAVGGSGKDASGSPVFSTEQPASTLTATGMVATFTAANPVGLFVGQIVKITGATGTGASAFNGTFRVVSVSGSSFTYNMETAYTGAAGGTPSFTVFLGVTSIVRSTVNGVVYAKVTTADKHRLQVGDTVSIWGATVGGLYDNPYNGAFRVETVTSDAANNDPFLCALEFDPGDNASGAISWASQNSTPLVRDKVGNTVFAEFTTDKPTMSGTIFNEGDLVSLFGAVVNGSFLNGYNTVVGVEPSPTARSFRFRVLGVDPSINGAGGIACALAKATPLTVDGTIGTFRTELEHRFFVGQAVQIAPSLPSPTSPFPGFSAVRSVPSSTVFTFNYATAPGGNSPAGYKFTAPWQVIQLVDENNVVELDQGKHPNSWGYSAGILASSGDFRPQYGFRSVLSRENIIRFLSGVVDTAMVGISDTSVENLVVERNLVDLSHVDPIQHQTIKSAKYFANQTSSGIPLRGYNNDINAALRFDYPELFTEIEDAILICL